MRPCGPYVCGRRPARVAVRPPPSRRPRHRGGGRHAGARRLSRQRQPRSDIHSSPCGGRFAEDREDYEDLQLRGQGCPAGEYRWNFHRPRTARSAAALQFRRLSRQTGRPCRSRSRAGQDRNGSQPPQRSPTLFWNTPPPALYVCGAQMPGAERSRPGCYK